jgi:uncharacterized membrane protein YvbJ
MFCPQCGTNVSSGQRFCRECGAEVGRDPDQGGRQAAQRPASRIAATLLPAYLARCRDSLKLAQQAQQIRHDS